MIFQDLKLTITNFIVLGFSFLNIEQYLKIILLGISIVYTAYKIYEIHTNIKEKKKNGSNNIREDKDTSSKD